MIGYTVIIIIMHRSGTSSPAAALDKQPEKQRPDSYTSTSPYD